MARVPLLDPEDVPDEAAFVDRVLSGRRGRLINVYRTLLHSPPLAESWFEHINKIRWGTEIDGRLREIVIIRLGHLDDVDMAMMCHTTSNPEEGQICMSGTNNGIVAKRIQFLGRGAHAGGAPHLGINALNAASLALMAIHSNRETFRDEDTIRVHPIITKGGEAVSAVPADVRMETFVRGKTLEAVLEANRKVDRALKAGAMAVGA